MLSPNSRISQNRGGSTSVPYFTGEVEGKIAEHEDHGKITKPDTIAALFADCLNENYEFVDDLVDQNPTVSPQLTVARHTQAILEANRNDNDVLRNSGRATSAAVPR